MEYHMAILNVLLPVVNAAEAFDKQTDLFTVVELAATCCDPTSWKVLSTTALLIPVLARPAVAAVPAPNVVVSYWAKMFPPPANCAEL